MPSGFSLSQKKCNGGIPSAPFLSDEFLLFAIAVVLKFDYSGLDFRVIPLIISVIQLA